MHALDDAFLNRQPGVDLAQHALAAVISLAADRAVIAAFPRLRPGLRAAIRERATEYERRIVAFFDEALLDEGSR